MPPIDHVVVLVLENRSFDHMLGLLDHPDPSYDGLKHDGPHTNPGWEGVGTTEAGPGAKHVLPVGPDHCHDAVMEQLAVVGRGRTRRATNQGFVQSYERKGRGLDPPTFGGILAPLLDRWARKNSAAHPVEGRGPLVMLCHSPGQVPVLTRLALGFAVCDQWFCSVPGETWPNRNFLHAATSHGKTNIEIQPYYDKTIFEVLEDNQASWHIYYDDTPQVWAFPKLWDTPARHARWFEFGHFADHVASGSLPQYSFIEPNHRPPLHTLDHDPVIGVPDVSDSQHPENNLVSNDAYDAYVDGGDCDFTRSESLVATVYETLRSHPDVLERTLLLVTYDEHGGLYDHVAPPATRPPVPVSSGSAFNPVDAVLGGVTKVLRLLWSRRAEAFDFTMLGLRVPAVVISPYISAGRIDPAVHDHTSVPATLRALFAPGAEALTERDKHAQPFHTLLDRDRPRRGAELPDLSAYVSKAPPRAAALAPEMPAGVTVPDHYQPFIAQADDVHAHLREVGEPETAGALPVGDLQRAAEIGRRFSAAADRHRTQPAP